MTTLLRFVDSFQARIMRAVGGIVHEESLRFIRENVGQRLAGAAFASGSKKRMGAR
jgi:hypothetical protein